MNQQDDKVTEPVIPVATGAGGGGGGAGGTWVAGEAGGGGVMPADHILQFFVYEHLPPKLQAVSKPFCDLARAIVGDAAGMPGGTSVEFPLPRNAERTVSLRKLLESKDAAVRAAIAK